MTNKKLTKENLKIGLNYRVISGETESVKPGDTMMVKFEKRKRHPFDEIAENDFTVFRWKREGKDGNRVWHSIKDVDKVFQILEPFEFEIDKEFGIRRLNHYQKEIKRIIENYGLDKDALPLPVFDNKDFRDNWDFENFVDSDGTMKEVKIEKSDSK